MKEMRRDQITGDLIIYSSYRNKRLKDTICEWGCISEAPASLK